MPRLRPRLFVPRCPRRGSPGLYFLSGRLPRQGWSRPRRPRRTGLPGVRRSRHQRDRPRRIHRSVIGPSKSKILRPPDLAEASRASRGGILSSSSSTSTDSRTPTTSSATSPATESSRSSRRSFSWKSASATPRPHRRGRVRRSHAADGRPEPAPSRARVIERVAAHRFTAHEDEIVSIGARRLRCLSRRHRDARSARGRRQDRTKTLRRRRPCLYLAKDAGKGRSWGPVRSRFRRANACPRAGAASQAGKKVPGA